MSHRLTDLRNDLTGLAGDSIAVSLPHSPDRHCRLWELFGTPKDNHSIFLFQLAVLKLGHKCNLVAGPRARGWRVVKWNLAAAMQAWQCMPARSEPARSPLSAPPFLHKPVLSSAFGFLWWIRTDCSLPGLWALVLLLSFVWQKNPRTFYDYFSKNFERETATAWACAIPIVGAVALVVSDVCPHTESALPSLGAAVLCRVLHVSSCIPVSSFFLEDCSTFSHSLVDGHSNYFHFLI